MFKAYDPARDKRDDLNQPIPVTRANLEIREYTPVMIYVKHQHAAVDFHNVNMALNEDRNYVDGRDTPETKANRIAVFKGPVHINGSLKSSNVTPHKMLPVVVSGMTALRNTGNHCVNTGAALRVRVPIYTNEDPEVKFDHDETLQQKTAIVEPFVPHDAAAKPIRRNGHEWRNRLSQVNAICLGGDSATPGQLFHCRVYY